MLRPVTLLGLCSQRKHLASFALNLTSVVQRITDTVCRQMIREFCEPDLKIYMYGRKPGVDYSKVSPEEEAKGETVIMTIGELLPMSFGPNDLAKREKKASDFTGKFG